LPAHNLHKGYLGQQIVDITRRLFHNPAQHPDRDNTDRQENTEHIYGFYQPLPETIQRLAHNPVEYEELMVNFPLYVIKSYPKGSNVETLRNKHFLYKDSKFH